jgi:ankyrin repeat protein
MAAGVDGLAGALPTRSGTARGGRRLLAVACAVAMLATPSLADEEVSLHALAARGDEAGLAHAIAAGNPVDQRDAHGQTALHVAAKEGHLFAAMVLVGHHADPNARDDQRRTPLHAAAQGTEREGERFQIVKMLIAKGANPKLRDATEKQPVDYARGPEFKAALAP